MPGSQKSTMHTIVWLRGTRTRCNDNFVQTKRKLWENRQMTGEICAVGAFASQSGVRCNYCGPQKSQTEDEAVFSFRILKHLKTPPTMPGTLGVLSREVYGWIEAVPKLVADLKRRPTNVRQFFRNFFKSGCDYGTTVGGV